MTVCTLLLAGLDAPVLRAAATPAHTLEYFRRIMPGTVRADHPAIAPVAAAIRAVTRDPLEQLALVNDVTHLLVDYDEDRRVYGRAEYHATLDEMIALRRQAGWLYLRDDCDGRAVFAAHLLATLGIPWRLEASRWKGHAWVVARVHGRDFDLLDLPARDPTLQRWSYRLVGRWFTRATNPPVACNWRKRWAERTGNDFATGVRLGMLRVDSTPAQPRERHCVDWARTEPDLRNTPFDPRALTAVCAGFPYGEPLQDTPAVVAKR